MTGWLGLHTHSRSPHHLHNVSVFLPAHVGRGGCRCDIALLFTLRSPRVHCWCGRRLLTQVLHCSRHSSSPPDRRFCSPQSTSWARLLPTQWAAVLRQLLPLPQARAVHKHQCCTLVTSCYSVLNVRFSHSTGVLCMYKFQTSLQTIGTSIGNLTNHWRRTTAHWLWCSCNAQICCTWSEHE